MDTLFRGVSIKPGHPVTVGKIGDTLLAALPGNPLAALLTLYTLVVPALAVMQGDAGCHHPFVPICSGETFRTNPKRTNIVLGNLKGGEFFPARGNRYGSGMIMPLAESDALALIGPGTEKVKAGDMLDVVVLYAPLVPWK